MSSHQRRLDQRPGHGRLQPAHLAWVTGLCVAVAALITAIARANLLVSLLLAGVAYLLSRYRYAGEAPAPWRYVPPLTLIWLAMAAVWIVVGDFILTGNSN